MKSSVLVISWWSNCLGLACLENIVSVIDDRPLYVIQSGKTPGQMDGFRRYMPSSAVEILFPSEIPDLDWSVRETAVTKLLPNEEGLWFFDHDLFFRDPIREWLIRMDDAFARSSVCLSHPVFKNRRSLTNPAFWTSPHRFPEQAPSFSPVAPSGNDRPAHELVIPEKDTLVAVREYLEPLGRVEEFPVEPIHGRDFNLPLFPEHDHIGGLYGFTFDEVPPHLTRWMRDRIAWFGNLYSRCPAVWRETESDDLRSAFDRFGVKV